MRNNCISTKRGQRWTSNVDVTCINNFKCTGIFEFDHAMKPLGITNSNHNHNQLKKLLVLCLLICVHNSSSLESYVTLDKTIRLFHNASMHLQNITQRLNLNYEPLCKTIVDHNKAISQTNDFDDNENYLKKQYYPETYSEIRCANISGEVNDDFNNSAVVDSNNLGKCSLMSGPNRNLIFNCIQQFRIILYLVRQEPKYAVLKLKARYALRSQTIRSGCECQQQN